MVVAVAPRTDGTVRVRLVNCNKYCNVIVISMV